MEPSCVQRGLAAAALAMALFAAASCTTDTAPSCGRTSPSALVKPDAALIASPAPDSFHVSVETSKGSFTILVHRDWAPNGADRFYHLVQLGYFNEARFFRVLKGFMAQFGVHGDPRINAAWEQLTIQDDPVKQTNKRGAVTFAQTSMPNSRGTQLFINYADNGNLDGMGFAPIGEVVDGMVAVDSLYGDYGEGAPNGPGPDQMRIVTEGNKYLNTSFPKLDFIRCAMVVQPNAEGR